MNLYLISQNKVTGKNTYDSAVVAAESNLDARTIHPSEFVTHISNGQWMGTNSNNKEYESNNHTWVSYEDIDCINVEYLGETNKERGVILAWFNAG